MSCVRELDVLADLDVLALSARFDSLFGPGRGGGVARENPVPGCVIAGPQPYSWYALVDPSTLDHVDSFRSLESARLINHDRYQGQMLTVGMSGKMPARSLGRIDPAGHLVV